MSEKGRRVYFRVQANSPIDFPGFVFLSSKFNSVKLLNIESAPGITLPSCGTQGTGSVTRTDMICILKGPTIL